MKLAMISSIRLKLPFFHKYTSLVITESSHESYINDMKMVSRSIILRDDPTQFQLHGL